MNSLIDRGICWARTSKSWHRSPRREHGGGAGARATQRRAAAVVAADEVEHQALLGPVEQQELVLAPLHHELHHQLQPLAPNGAAALVAAAPHRGVRWKNINENREGIKDIANDKYHVLIEKLNSFKQLDDENVESIYLRLNVLVNEINSLGVKQIGEYSRLNVLMNEINSLGLKQIGQMKLIRKILHSLRRPAMIW